MGRQPTLRQRVASVAIDTTALRASAPFRRLFGAQLASSIGTQVTFVALQFQVFQLARHHGAGIPQATFYVGAIGVAQVLTTVPLALVGGAIADSMDRRRLLVAVQVGLCVVSASLAVLALHHPPLAAIYILAAANAGLSAIDNPTRSAVIPMLVDQGTLRSAVQLREVLTQSGRVFGPVVGGAILALTGGPAWAYAVDAASFAFAFSMYVRLPRLLPQVRRRFELSSIAEGLGYVRRQPVLASSFAADLLAMVFGMPRAAFPALAALFGVGAFGFGVLSAAVPAGAMIGLAFAGLTRHVRREGLAVVLSVAIWGAAIAVAGLVHSFALVLVLFAIAGAADMVSALFRQTILFALVPDELRGRMSSIHILVVTGGPPVGDLEAGAAASVFGVRPSIVIGGVVSLAGVVGLATRVPAFVRWIDPSRLTATTPASAD